MQGENNLATLLAAMSPQLQQGDYVFCVVDDLYKVHLQDVLAMFSEKEGYTLVLEKRIADAYALPYHFVAAFITLNIHSALNAVGLTAAFSAALAAEGISCNVIAAYYHDHIFVEKKDAEKAMQVLIRLTKKPT
jgi:uncharacterized protein